MATVALLVTAGCGDNGSDGADASPDGETLQDFMGLGGDPESSAAQFEEQQRDIEQHIAECMAQQGFEYVPREQTAGAMAQAHPRQDMSQEEFTEEFGYGISTIDMSERGGQAQATDEAVADPNAEIMQDMDEAELQAYQEALHGQPPEVDPDDPEGSVEWEPGGCRGEAETEVRGAAQEIQRELGDELTALFERVESDPRIIEAQEGWAACMREAGWEFSERSETFQHISEQMNQLLQDARPDEMPEFEPGDEAFDEDFEPPAPPEPDPDALAELQAEELELAAIDWECTVEHIGEDYELYLEVQQEYEAEFIDEHRDLLEELRDG